MKRMKISVKIFLIAFSCVLICTVVFACLFIKADKNESVQDINSETIVALNEVSELLDIENTSIGDDSETDKLGDDELNIENKDLIKEKISTLIIKLQDSKETGNNGRKYIVIAYLISVAVIIILFLIIWFIILRPFKKLERFAGELADGNYDSKLKYERVNMFGEFTWAFDHMRSELKKSREREQEAVENNKTIIATLSHDIKTPVASIRAYAEGLSENMDSSPERRERYINVIMKKCDEVSKVTDDMFIHSLHALDRLVINKDEVDLDKVINDTIESLKGDKNDIAVKGEIDTFTLHEADSMRISQVIENIITNARKYAEGSRIEVWSEIKDSYCLHIKDNGTGIPPEDMPFVFDKFYRGKNKSDKSGAGLGLFIVKYIMEAMGGSVELNNSRNGLEVLLTFNN